MNALLPWHLRTGVPRSQHAMHKLVINGVVERAGLEQSQQMATIFDGITRHNPEGMWFRRLAQVDGFKAAVRCACIVGVVLKLMYSWGVVLLLLLSLLSLLSLWSLLSRLSRLRLRLLVCCAVVRVRFDTTFRAVSLCRLACSP